MDAHIIDMELEQYVGDRMKSGSREAFQRLYLRAVARFSGPALSEHLDLLRRSSMAYASICHTLRTPVCHLESPLFLSSLTLVAADMVMMASGELTTLVACGTSAGIVGMAHCVRRIVGLWRLYAVQEAVFRELAEILRSEAMADERQPA